MSIPTPGIVLCDTLALQGRKKSLVLRFPFLTFLQTSPIPDSDNSIRVVGWVRNTKHTFRPDRGCERRGLTEKILPAWPRSTEDLVGHLPLFRLLCTCCARCHGLARACVPSRAASPAWIRPVLKLLTAFFAGPHTAEPSRIRNGSQAGTSAR